MPLTSVSGMHVTGRLKLSDPPSEGTPRRVTQLSQYGGNLTIVLEVQFHGFHAFFTRVHGHPPVWSRILSACPAEGFARGRPDGERSVVGPAISMSESCVSAGRIWSTLSPHLVPSHARRRERLESLLSSPG